MEALASCKGSAWTKGPESCEGDLAGVTAIGNVFVSTNVKLHLVPEIKKIDAWFFSHSFMPVSFWVSSTM